MSWLNKSNKSNKSDGEQSELDLAGQSTSSLMTTALDEAARVYDENIPAPRNIPMQVPVNYLRLNARHLNEVLTAQLMAGMPDQQTLIDETNSECVQAGITPSTGLGGVDWADQIDRMRIMKYNRSNRLAEIYLQQTDIISFLGQPVGIGNSTHRRMMQMLDAVWAVAFRITVPVKLLYSTRRPIEIAPDLAPVIQTPAHSSFPAGHAIEAFALGMTLARYFPYADGMLHRAAGQVAMHRVYAGVHFPLDVEWGNLFGACIARHTWNIIQNAPASSPLAVINTAAINETQAP